MPLTNEQFDEISREYEARRIKARHLREQRLAEVRKKIPALADLDEAVSETARGFAERFSAGEDSSPDIRARFAQLHEQREALLTDAGFPADYLDNVWQCSLCRDTGFVGNEKCSCFRRRESELLYEQSHLENLARDLRFESLSDEPFRNSEADLAHYVGARDAARTFAEQFEKADRNLLFMGSVGTGKTTLSVCVAGELIRRGYAVLYFSAVSLFERLARQQFSNDTDPADDNFRRDLFDCDLLVIDDLGTELTNAFSAEQLFVILNERSIRDRRLVISTNLGFDDLQRVYGERIFSRLTSSSIILKLTGHDLRLDRYL